MTSELYIGLMSGTSLDAIDAVLVSFGNHETQLLASLEYEFPLKLRNHLKELIQSPESASIDHLGTAHRQLGLLYAAAVETLLENAGKNATSIKAIGCHGQTIRHRPDLEPSFTLQIGDAATLAIASGITTVNDFRSADIALGGQGAPLVPAFHQWAFGTEDTKRAIVNIGGIANISILHPGKEIIGFDTGPGNTLLDTWCNEHRGKAFDHEGAWAATGEINTGLLATLLTDAYFAMAPPKSTGREYFNSAWAARCAMSMAENLSPVDMQATLAELTAATIATAIEDHAMGADIFLCGGGALNTDLVGRIGIRLPGYSIAETSTLGIAPSWVEATAFAWLARARIHQEPGNVPTVTGATRPAVLGAVYSPL